MVGEEGRDDEPAGVDETVTEGGASSAPPNGADGQSPPPSVLAPAPAAIDDLAGACVRFVQRALGVELDYTPETLPLLDHYLDAARSAARDKPEPAEVVVEAAGAYLGEVVRRRHPSWWRIDDGPHAARLEFRDLFLSFSPMDMIRDALAAAPAEDDGAGLAFDLASFELDEADRPAVTARLGELPDVPFEEYYAPSTRVEVLDIVVDAVRARRLADGDPELELEAEDYATHR